MKTKKLTRAAKMAMGLDKPVVSKYEAKRRPQVKGALLGEAISQEARDKLRNIAEGGNNGNG